MFKNRILGPPTITLLAIFFCLIAVRVEHAAQQGSQPDKSTSKEPNSQSSGPQSPGGAESARWPIFLPTKSQPSGGVAQEQKPELKQESEQKKEAGQKPEQKPESEQKQESKTTPAPPATEKQSPLQPLRPQSINQGDQDRIKEFTDLVSLPVTVTDAYNRLVTGLDRHHFEIF